MGCEVSLAFNGQEALDILNAKPRGFDLVVTDIVMPVMDGYGLLKSIQASAHLAHLFPAVGAYLGGFATPAFNEQQD
jgi:CheY-like chemotaxis protein